MSVVYVEIIETIVETHNLDFGLQVLTWDSGLRTMDYGLET